ncbi:NRDE family protein [Sporosarcina sp. FA9]|uniref:NRDE family protein n=1 Tax=Sporosarcina sp. FA9 TaxID=3413030 RepID=UPI003F65819F
MCLINFHINEHPSYKIILAANRDESYSRPTAPAQFWSDEPTILAGRDLLQSGTWLGVTKTGRIAALTNYRDPSLPTNGKISRGEIIRNYLAGTLSPKEYLTALNEKKELYTGFNVIVGNPDELFYYNNLEAKIVEIEEGTHGLSNHFLDTPWPKVLNGKRMLREYVLRNETVEEDQLFEILSMEDLAEDQDLPSTGVGIDLERQLSPLFIKTDNYGTRSSTVLTIDNDDNVTFIERTYEKGLFKEQNKFEFKIDK